MEKLEVFASQWGIIFAGLGMAVGTVLFLWILAFTVFILLNKFITQKMALEKNVSRNSSFYDFCIRRLFRRLSVFPL